MLRFPTGFMDVIQIEKTGENFRIIYDVKGRFTVHRITSQEAKYKLCKVREVKVGPNAVPYLYTTDGRTIRYPDPIIKVSISIFYDYDDDYESICYLIIMTTTNHLVLKLVLME